MNVCYCNPLMYCGLVHGVFCTDRTLSEEIWQKNSILTTSPAKTTVSCRMLYNILLCVCAGVCVNSSHFVT